MFNLNVKTSTPLIRLMQVLCLFSLCQSISVAQTQAPVKSDAGAVVTMGTPQTNLSAMNREIEQWFYKNHEIKSKDLTIKTLDPRLQVGSCSKPLTIDHPFSSKETVRVRCSDPIWQLYVQISLNNSSSVAGSKTAAPQIASTAVPSAPVQTVRNVVVPKIFLKRGSVIQADWLEVVQVPTGAVDTSLLGTVADAQQFELVRDVPAGQPIKSSDIRKAILVRQGQMVLMSVGDKVGYQITVRAEALQDGRLGEQVKLKNSESGRQISGVVTGPNTAKGL
jgi:flagella basal body P-ring formation protein FlgA